MSAQRHDLRYRSAQRLKILLKCQHRELVLQLWDISLDLNVSSKTLSTTCIWAQKLENCLKLVLDLQNSDLRLVLDVQPRDWDLSLTFSSETWDLSQTCSSINCLRLAAQRLVLDLQLKVLSYTCSSNTCRRPAAQKTETCLRLVAQRLVLDL